MGTKNRATHGWSGTERNPVSVHVYGRATRKHMTFFGMKPVGQCLRKCAGRALSGSAQAIRMRMQAAICSQCYRKIPGRGRLATGFSSQNARRTTRWSCACGTSTWPATTKPQLDTSACSWGSEPATSLCAPMINRPVFDADLSARSPGKYSSVRECNRACQHHAAHHCGHRAAAALDPGTTSLHHRGQCVSARFDRSWPLALGGIRTDSGPDPHADGGSRCRARRRQLHGAGGLLQHHSAVDARALAVRLW